MKNDTHLGILAEKQFIVDAMKRNLLVSVPSYDHNGYDAIVQGKKNLYKVQIKSTRQKEFNKNGYKVCVFRGRENKTRYEKHEVDFFAVYLTELSLWYIVPFAMCKSSHIRIYPDKNNHRLNSFLEAWHLFT